MFEMIDNWPLWFRVLLILPTIWVAFIIGNILVVLISNVVIIVVEVAQGLLSRRSAPLEVKRLPGEESTWQIAMRVNPEYWGRNPFRNPSPKYEPKCRCGESATIMINGIPMCDKCDVSET